MRRLFLPLLVVSLVAASTPSLVAGGQSLADLARKEEERRKGMKPADKAKLITNKDLGDVPPPTATTPAPAEPVAADAAAQDAKAAAAKKQEGEGEKEPVKDQAYWAGRMKELKTKLSRDEVYADALQTRINSLTTDFVNRDDPAQRGVVAGDKQKAMDELSRLKQQIVDERKAIADLEEEARRAGVPPGWLR